MKIIEKYAELCSTCQEKCKQAAGTKVVKCPVYRKKEAGIEKK